MTRDLTYLSYEALDKLKMLEALMAESKRRKEEARKKKMELDEETRKRLASDRICIDYFDPEEICGS